MTVDKLLYQMGFTSNYVGYWYIRYALELCDKDPMIMTRIKKDLYPSIAQKFCVTEDSVERAIRRLIGISWKNEGRQAMEKLLHRHLPEPPSNGRFISALSVYIHHSHIRLDNPISEQTVH